MLRRIALASALAMAWTTHASADGTGSGSASDSPSASASDSVSAGRRAAAIGLAVIPGFAVRGLGSVVVHQPRAGHRLLRLGGIGLGAALIGGVPLYLTYGSAKLIVPGVHLSVGGAGLIMASWWSDIYSAAGGDRLGGRPRTLPALTVELGGTWQHDAYLGERILVTPAAELRRGRWAARAAALVATDGSARGGRLDVETRPWSRPPPEAAGVAAARHTGTTVAFRAALQVHGERDQGFALTTGELAIHGRLDLAQLDRHLRGTFLDLEEGLGLELATYTHAGTDVQTLLLSRFGWGVYLPGGRGELGVFYDHRRDTLAGGVPAGPAAGFFGSIGTTAQVVITRRWTAFAEVELGTDWLTTLALRRELP